MKAIDEFECLDSFNLGNEPTVILRIGVALGCALDTVLARRKILSLSHVCNYIYR